MIVTGESSISFTGHRTPRLYVPQTAACANQSNPKSGANSPAGIGRASAHQYAHNGAKAVYICDYDPTHLATHKREIETLYPGVDVHTRQFDAADEVAVKSVVDDAIQRYGRLDIFFANAGIVGQPKIFTDISGEDFMKTLKTNTLGLVCFMLSRWLKEDMY